MKLEVCKRGKKEMFLKGSKVEEQFSFGGKEIMTSESN